MPQLMKRIRLWGISVSVATCALSGLALAQDALPFDAAKSFCDRQTFVLESVGEVKPWLDYFSGLRNGRSPAPGNHCPSSTVRAIVNIVGSGSIEATEAARTGFFSFYVARAMEKELADRRIDMDGSFRYRNDIVLAGFVWLLCPGHGDQRLSCVRRNVGDFPTQFIQTSPVFCDFAKFDKAKVEWPSNPSEQPLVCASGGSQQSENVQEWLTKAAHILGE